MNFRRPSEPVILSRTIDTADGPFTIVVEAHGAVVAAGWVTNADAALMRIRSTSMSHVLLGTHTRAHDTAHRADAMCKGLDGATYAVTAYYSGKHDAPTAIPVAQFGTDFQQHGWETLRTVPASAPVTYAGFAALMGKPTAVRAAASVCARNAVGLFVPCHRVVRADGQVGDFAWGNEIKSSLVAREK